MDMSSYATEIAHNSLDIGSIKLRPDDPFLWASGYRMPVYNDNRMNLRFPHNRDVIVNAFIEAIKEEGIFPQCLAGTSTAGIPWASIVSDKMYLPMTYVRDKPKDHGLRNRIEGLDNDKDYEGTVVALFEDLVSTGGSSASAAQAVLDANGVLPVTFSIFSYGFADALEMFEGKRPYDKETDATLSRPCKLRPLLTYEVLIDVARQTGHINDAQAKLLEEWRADPYKWGEKRGFPQVKKGK